MVKGGIDPRKQKLVSCYLYIAYSNAHIFLIQKKINEVIVTMLPSLDSVNAINLNQIFLLFYIHEKNARNFKKHVLKLFHKDLVMGFEKRAVVML